MEAMYRERASPVAGGVLWTRTSAPDETQFRVLPDGCMDLIWSDDALVVAGPDTAAQLTPTQPGMTYTGVRFAPGVGPAVLRVPADVLRDQRVRLDVLWPEAQARALAERIAAATDPTQALEQVAVGRRREVGQPDGDVAAIVTALRTNGSVRATAATVGLSERQLHRRCLAAFGYGPKTLVRVLRLQHALALVGAGTAFATAAAVAGYADQAHMARQVKDLTGQTLGTLTR